MVPVDIVNSHDQIIVALVALLGTTIAALVYLAKNRTMLKDAAADVRAVNDAVNHAGHGEVRIFEQVSAIITKLDHVAAEVERQRGYWEEQHDAWASLPPDIHDAVGLVTILRRLMDDVHELKEKP